MMWGARASLGTVQMAKMAKMDYQAKFNSVDVRPVAQEASWEDLEALKAPHVPGPVGTFVQDHAHARLCHR